ncbi:mavicyanin [Cajanus cajan]|uniref:Mavicyanin n=1 Tax=Cajanus cajan TaxID=3821 RepID=A0A151RNB2_CAJCA|nr:mavicyanin [Cajanus cajan]KYP44049.1 Mavicyanin [Cajanus cajan]
MGHKNTIFLALVATLIAKEAFAAQHVVGGSQGWDQSTDFKTWISGQTFKVGDKLVFKYTSLHSVVELGSESAYKNCDISSPIKSLSTGNDVVKLDKPGTRYFTCGTLGHCSQGMKVKITTVKGNALSPASSPSPSSSPLSSSSPSSSPSSSTTTTTDTSSASQCFTSFIFILALSVTIMISLF